MKLKPQDFFIGVIDFFSVILPGALVTYFLKVLLSANDFGVYKVFPLPESETQQWIVFLVATYIIGHIIFLVASFLDKLVYDKRLSKLFYKKNFDFAYLTATSIREQYLYSSTWIGQHITENKLTENKIKEFHREKNWEIINTFKWAQSFLAIKYPETLVDINKFEADSKFFRSLVVAFIIIGSVQLLYIDKEEWKIGTCFFVLSLLSLYRYGDLRYKSTQKAYELIITINHKEKGLFAGTDPLTLDNRVLFEAPAKVAASYQNRIASLTKGLHVNSKMLAIPWNETWNVLNLPYSETLYCLSGRCMAKVTEDNSEDGKIIIVPNAIVPLQPKLSFKITNKQQGPLLLLSVK